MKIAILTFAVTNNYGATLQCYAMQEFLRKNGHETFIINVPLMKAAFPRKKTSFCQRVKRKFSRIINKSNENERYHRTKDELAIDNGYAQQNMALFDKFREKYFINLTHPYIAMDDLLKDYPEADAFIVGSDQVWNLWITNYQYPIFFLDFAKEGAIKISYAACMGGDSNFEFFDDEIKNIKNYLSSFNAISVRDITGVKILNEKFNINPNQVLDPTFLIDSYDKLLEDSDLDASGCMFNFKFIINDQWVSVIKHISNDLKLKVRMDTCLIPIKEFPFAPVCSVQDWLKLIKTSDFVFTDSFHGMVFCILFKKQFIATPSYAGGEERYFDLAQKLGLQDRVFTKCSDVINSKIWERTIDYENVYSKLYSLKTSSKKFLLEALCK